MKIKNRKMKKSIKNRIKRGINGSISILLCLVMTPFASVALSLVEYARYQEVINLSEEVTELTAFSELADYDTYLQDRFGLLATSQENSLGSSTAQALEDNFNVLGNQVELKDINVEGKYALNNADILEQQIMDVSELSGAAAILAKDFNLEELLEKLKGLDQFNDVMDTMDGIANMANALSDAITALEDLQTVIDEANSAISTVKNTATTLSTKFSNLLKKLGDDGITIPQGATDEEIEEIIAKFAADDSYIKDLQNIYKSTKTLINNLNTAKTKLGEIPSKVEAVKTAIQDAVDAAESISDTNSADEDGKISEAATKTLDSVMADMEKLLNETLNDIKQTTIDTAKEAVDDIKNEVLESVGVAGVKDRYSLMISGSYFATPMNETAKQDLIDFLNVAYDVYNSKDPSAFASFFKEKFIPDINLDISDIKSRISSVITKATEKLKNSVGEKLTETITTLVNVVEGLFDLDVFYNDKFTASVNIGDAYNSPYQDFLVAIGTLFTSIDEFKNAIVNLRPVKMLKELADMMISIKDMFVSVTEIAGEYITSIAELSGDLIGLKMQSLYEKLLLCGYARHNMPCRTSEGKISSSYEGGTATYTRDLVGTGLTGFDYNDIARPGTVVGQDVEYKEDVSKFEGLVSTIDDLKNGGGSDEMFTGAELEYIRAGTSSEIANQIIVFLEIYFLRLLIDIPSVFIDGGVASVASAATIASWVVYILYIVVEPFCDTIILVNGGEVPMFRTKCWLTATNMTSFLEKLAGVTMGEELRNSLTDLKGKASEAEGTVKTKEKDMFDADYQTHVMLMMMLFEPKEDLLNRLQGIIDLETSYYYSSEKGKTFNMNKAYTAVQIRSDATFNALFDFGVASGGPSKLYSTTIKQTVSY